MAVIDINLLRIMKHRKEYNQLVGRAPVKALDPKTQALVKDFGKYFEMFPEHSQVDLELFGPMFKRWHPSLNDEDYSAYLQMIRTLAHDIDQNTTGAILGDLFEIDLSANIMSIVDRYERGEMSVGLLDEINAVVDAYKINTGATTVAWNDVDIGDLLKEDIDDSGLKWRLGTLNECMRGLRGGDFGLVCGRPDKGKTTFCASELTYMAGQLPPDKNIVWLNNEGVGGRIVKRLYQAALGMRTSEMVELHQQGKLKEAYAKVVGRLDRIRVIDIHGYHTGQVQAILENIQPGLVLFDMIDNVRGFNVGGDAHHRLEEMYKWARECAVKYDCVILATSQISAEGDGQQFPTLGMLKDSKTGKQGACDFQLMIGAVNDSNLEGVRWLSLPKNKLRREGASGDPKAEVRYLPQIARYKDTPLGV